MSFEENRFGPLTIERQVNRENRSKIERRRAKGRKDLRKGTNAGEREREIGWSAGHFLGSLVTL